MTRGQNVAKTYKARNGKSKYNSLRLLIEVIITLIILLMIMTTIVGVSRVDGDSMEPTLSNKDLITFNRLAKNYEVGDVVAIKMPSGDKYVKRIVAMEGDVVEIKDGKLFVNGKVERSGFAKGDTLPQNDNVIYPCKISKGSVFVLGDNRRVSVDSRTFGEVANDCISGTINGL